MKSLKQVWDRSLPRPVGETGRRSVGNGKERLRDYAGFPGRQPNVTRARSAHKNKTLHACFFRARWLPQSRLRRSSSLPEGASSYTNDSRISMAYL